MIYILPGHVVAAHKDAVYCPDSQVWTTPAYAAAAPDDQFPQDRGHLLPAHHRQYAHGEGAL